MKADEPNRAERLVKYGLPASDVPPIEARRHVVMQERKAIQLALAHRDLERMPALLAELDRIAGQVSPRVVAVEVPEEEVAPEPPAVEVRQAEPRALKPLGLRASLGLG